MLVLLASVYRGEIEAQRSEVTYPRPHSYERLRRDLNPVCLTLESELFTTARGCLSVTAAGNGVRSLCRRGVGGWGDWRTCSPERRLREAGSYGDCWPAVAPGQSTAVLLCAHLRKCGSLAQVLPTLQGCWDLLIQYLGRQMERPLGPWRTKHKHRDLMGPAHRFLWEPQV